MVARAAVSMVVEVPTAVEVPVAVEVPAGEGGTTAAAPTAGVTMAATMTVTTTADMAVSMAASSLVVRGGGAILGGGDPMDTHTGTRTTGIMATLTDTIRRMGPILPW